MVSLGAAPDFDPRFHTNGYNSGHLLAVAQRHVLSQEVIGKCEYYS